MDRIGQEHQVAVDMSIDETRNDIKSIGIKDFLRGRVSKMADFGDLPVLNRNVRPEGRPTTSVDHPATLRDQVEFHGGLS